jgi:hypothetical protein
VSGSGQAWKGRSEHDRLELLDKVCVQTGDRQQLKVIRSRLFQSEQSYAGFERIKGRPIGRRGGAITGCQHPHIDEFVQCIRQALDENSAYRFLAYGQRCGEHERFEFQTEAGVESSVVGNIQQAELELAYDSQPEAMALRARLKQTGLHGVSAVVHRAFNSVKFCCE